MSTRGFWFLWIVFLWIGKKAFRFPDAVHTFSQLCMMWISTLCRTKVWQLYQKVWIPWKTWPTTWMRSAAFVFSFLFLQVLRLLTPETLKHMQELDRQVPLMDEIDTKVRKCIIPAFWTAVISVLLTYNELCFDLSQVDKATSDLKNTNVRLKDTVTQVNELHGLQCLYIFILFF